MAGVPKADAPQPPTANDLSHHPRTVQIRLTWAKGKIVEGIYAHIVANIEDTGAFVTVQAIYVLWPVGLAASHRTVIDGMRPGITRLKLEALAEASLQRQTK